MGSNFGVVQFRGCGALGLSIWGVVFQGRRVSRLLRFQVVAFRGSRISGALHFGGVAFWGVTLQGRRILGLLGFGVVRFRGRRVSGASRFFSVNVIREIKIDLY